MPNLGNSSKGGFEPGLSRLRVLHSTTELSRSNKHSIATLSFEFYLVTHIKIYNIGYCTEIVNEQCNTGYPLETSGGLYRRCKNLALKIRDCVSLCVGLHSFTNAYVRGFLNALFE